MKIDYILLDPSKNMTVLVKSPVEPALRPAVAAVIMEVEPLCEQVGFISAGEGDCDIRLNMAGGEFCGNAAMSAAVLNYLETEKENILVSVSGCDEPVSVNVRRAEYEGYTGTVTMPKPVSIREEMLGGDSLPVVSLPGISHIVTEKHFTRAECEKNVREWCAKLGCDALGIMLLDKAEDRITPLVYVPSADTIFWEQSCASGTTAVGIYLAETEGKAVKRRFIEPGSALTVEAAPNQHPKLTGNVRIISESTIEY